jgi:cobalt-zinc-cadmium efflux system protein
MNDHSPHGHPHGHHHAHPSPAEGSSRLVWALLLTLGFALIEVVAGFWSGSLALLGDAGHMFTDSASLGLTAIAAWLARRPPSRHHTYGLGRVETLAALFNVVFMVLVVVAISVAAVQRFLSPQPIIGSVVTLVAVCGLLINLGVAWLLMHGEQTMNTRGALLHVMGDLLGSVAALVAGAVIMWTGWTPIDPLLSLLICLLVLVSSLRLLRALLEGVPAHISLEQIAQSLAKVDGVHSVHDLHVWTLSSNRVALSAHLAVNSFSQWPEVLEAARHRLAHQGITHVTLQPESASQTIQWLPRPAAGGKGGEAVAPAVSCE